MVSGRERERERESESEGGNVKGGRGLARGRIREGKMSWRRTRGGN